jgi:hypothetical protein
MKKWTMDMTNQVFRGFVFATCLTFVFTLSFTNVSIAKTAKEIDSEVNEALNLFSKQGKGAKEFLNTARGILVIPNMVKAGLGVGGCHEDWRKDSRLLRPCGGIGRTSDRGPEDTFGAGIQARRRSQKIPGEFWLESRGGRVSDFYRCGDVSGHDEHAGPDRRIPVRSAGPDGKRYHRRCEVYSIDKVKY